MADRKLKAILEAVDKASPVFRSFSEKSSKSLRKVINAAGAAGAALGVLGGVVLVKAIKDAAEFESATVRLAVALANQGQNTAEARAELLDFSRALTDVSLATETQIISGIASAKALGATNEAAKRLIASATDLASATGIDMDTAFRQVNRTLGGFAGELGEIIPELKELTAEELKAGKAAEILEAKFGGAGKAGADTLAGSVNNLNSALKQLSVEIGKPFGEVLQVVFEELTRAIKGARDQISGSESFRDDVFNAAIGVVNFSEKSVLALGYVGEAFAALKVPASGLANTIRAATTFIGIISQDRSGDLTTALRAGLDEAAKDFEKVEFNVGAMLDRAAEASDTLSDLGFELERIRATKGPESDVPDKLDNIAGAARKASAALTESQLSQNLANLQSDIDRFFGPDQLLGFRFDVENLQAWSDLAEQTGASAAQAFEPFRVEMLGINEAIDILVNEGAVALGLSIADASVELETLGQTIQRDLKGVGVGAALDFGDALVDAATGADVDFKKFFKNLLKDIAKAIVQATILKAILGAGGGGTTGSLFESFVPIGLFGSKGMVVGAANGIVAGGVPGRDSVPVIAQQGEAILPKNLTSFLMEAARGAAAGGGSTVGGGGAGGSAPVTVNINAVDGQSVRRLLEDNPEAFGAGFRRAARLGAV